MLGLVGNKCGMTRVFNEAGEGVPVTVLELRPNRITQIKTIDTDGYSALQVTAGERKVSRVNKPSEGHFAKAKVEAGVGLWEFRLADLSEFNVGDNISVDIFKEGQFIDVQGTSKGKGFAGAVKRHNFSMQDATHGNSLSHRAPGSIGQNQSPRKVFKNKKMAGQMGNVKKTIQNQEIVRVDLERNLILVKGAVPGPTGGQVIVLPAVKRQLQELVEG